MLMVFILVSSSTVSNCICVFIYLVPATAEKYTTLSDELKVHPVLSMPENELTRALNAKISFSHVNTHFSHSTALLQQEKNIFGLKGKNDITRQIQNNSFTVTSLTFLRFPVKWNPADIHFASPAIVKSKRPAYPSCCAV